MSGAYILLTYKLFPNVKVALDRFHIIQHLGRAFLKTRIAIMNQFDKKSLPFRSLKITDDSFKSYLSTLFIQRLSTKS